MSLQSLKRRLNRVETKAAQRELHVVMLFTGTSDLNHLKTDSRDGFVGACLGLQL